MQISFIILNYKSGRLVRNCLNAILELNLQYKYEIIVADNNSSDPFWHKLKELFPQVKFISNQKNGGFGYGNNQAIKSANGYYLVVLNPDVYLQPGAIEVLYEFMENHTNCAISGPKLINAAGHEQTTRGRYPDWKLPFFRRTFLGKTKTGQQWLSHYLYLDENFDQAKSVDWLLGACLFIRKTDFEKVGGFDEYFFMYMEDIDLCRRLTLTGKKIYYLPQATAIHLHQRDSAELFGLKGLIKASGRWHLISWLKYCWRYRK
jgi:GT2 family glycosyltransferase